MVIEFLFIDWIGSNVRNLATCLPVTTRFALQVERRVTRILHTIAIQIQAHTLFGVFSWTNAASQIIL